MRGEVALVVVSTLAACASEHDAARATSPPHADEGASADAGRPPFETTFDDGGPTHDDAAAPYPAPDPALHARLEAQLRGITRSEYAAHDWGALLATRTAWSGVKIWIPGTGCRTFDRPGSRAMAAVPSGFASGGPAMAYAGSGSIGVWLGIPSSQAEGGARFADRGSLSALEVFDTAWTDALAIVAMLGPKLKGAWIVGHSAGANPAILAGVLGGAARVDAYGVPSIVGPLDGDDGLVHLHTHPLDPAGSMGKAGATGDAEIDLFSAFVKAIESGGNLSNHDYASWPAPAP